MNDKAHRTIKVRQKKVKENVVESLKKVPIIQLACEKCGISRATFYRWLDQSPKFKKEIEKVVLEGHQLIGDMAESKLIQLIKDGNLGAIIFYLKTHRKKYQPVIATELKPYDPDEEEISEKEKKMLRKILKDNS